MQLAATDYEVLGSYSPEDRVHVERHARLTLQIGEFIGLRSSETRPLVQASLLHEFGRIGFRYALRDELAGFAKAYDFTEVLSRTALIRGGALPDWPSPDQVVAAVENQIALRASELRGCDPARWVAFTKDASAIGIASDGRLPEQQRRNLRILYAHDGQTLANIREMRGRIPFAVDYVLEILAEFNVLLERQEPRKGSDRELLMAAILLAADQVEITNNRTRWLRSRRHPQFWQTLHLVDEAVAGRDATLPSVHAVLVDRTGHDCRAATGRVRNAVYEMVFGRHKSLIEVIEEARESQIADIEWKEVAAWRARQFAGGNGTFSE